MGLKEKYIKLVVKEWKKKSVEEKLKDAKTCYDDNTHLGACGIEIALTIAWLRENLVNKISKRNKKSDKLLIKWLKSNMRDYCDFGTFDSWVGEICKRFWGCEISLLEEELKKSEGN